MMYDQSMVYQYYPCIKYKILAEPESDGTDTFIVAESINTKKSNNK